MRISRARIRNFRALDDVEIRFEDITTFIGPNGVGKSSILRALDWFFNGSALAEDDLFSGADEKSVSVEVEFQALTDSDRDKFGKYAVSGRDTVTIWKRWEDGKEKLYGRGRQHQPFAEIRKQTSASDRNRTYREFRNAHPDYDLPASASDGPNQAALEAWEHDHPNQLQDVDIDSASHLFGFYGQGLMSGLFDFVLVTADLRATEESQDSRSTVVGRILQQVVDRAGADAELLELAHDIEKRRDDIHMRNYGPQLEALSRQMTEAVSALSSGREICVLPDDAAVPPMKAQFKVRVLDDDTDTPVGKQGHGFQRALIISALQLLAEHGRGKGEGSVICLVIEEPELFQHPLQAKNFARVLRELAGDPANGVQIAYATHSPYFVEPRAFHQVRRVVREGAGSAGSVTVRSSTVDAVVARLAGFVSEEQVRRQVGSVCMGSLAEALFADKVVVTEGTTDCGVINGCADRDRCLLLDGVCTTDAGSKTDVLLPYTVLDELGIPTVLFVDNDRHLEGEVAAALQRSDQRASANLAGQVTVAKTMNRKLLEFFGLSPSDWPQGRVSDHLVFVDMKLEESLRSEWPEWQAKFAELDQSGSGRKNAAVYYDTSRLASGAVPPFIADTLRALRAL